MKKQPLAIALLVLFVASTLHAHDLFFKLESYFLAPNGRVRVTVFNGTFTSSENSVARDRLVDISVASAGRVDRLPVSAWRARKTTSELTFATGPAGTYVLGASIRPRQLTLTGKEFNAYLEEEGVLDVLAARTKANELEREARERYSKHVKAIVQVGDARTADFATTLGYPAEIIPLENPYTIRPGGSLRVRCLVDGRPVVEQVVLAGYQPTSRRARPPQTSVRTDAQGVAKIEIPAAGKWYVKFVNMVPLLEAEADYESKWATMTFQVK